MWVVCNGINTSEEVTGREIRPCKRIKNSETKGMDNSETEEAEQDPCSVAGGCHDVPDASDDGICGRG